MVVPGLCIAAPSSGTGKTTIATGLIRALARRMEVAPFKVGPDYIDPGYHGLAAGRVGRNLDSVMCGGSRIGPLYAHGSSGCDISVVEGVMGLFDGRIAPGSDPVCAPGSTAEIAHTLGLPVVLVVDVRGMSQSIGALVRGFATAVDGVRLAGVILNQVGTERHEAICRRACEAVGVPVFGALPRFADIEVPSRHLGLVTAVERGGVAVAAVERMADLVERHLDLGSLIAAADCGWNGTSWAPESEVSRVGDPTIAVAGGPAFTFAYAEHTELLVAAGARVVRFDPLVDDLPDCDGLIIPGGFPEEHVENLAGRNGLRMQVRDRIADGMPVHGECAGLLWLTASLDAHPMLGVIGTHAVMGRRLTLGYREAVAISDSLLHREGERVTGHEFHHTALTATIVPGWAPSWGWRGWDGRSVREGFTNETVHASYLHCHPTSVPQSIERFVSACN
ncbi:MULTISPECIES: cobyrinate a,c-diamide synthase [unclassified Corynebacterium]|uniref:cobyrinate a,c-diamide synthase n=1 Tax=unclassified Corynebacterium TaxID=2624378 RepID=UPI00352596F3